MTNDPAKADPAVPPRDHFLPVAQHELIDQLRTLGVEKSADPDQLSGFLSLLGALYHHRARQRLENLKRDYLPFAPDSDTPLGRYPTGGEVAEVEARCMAELEETLKSANFQELTQSDIEAALTAHSPHGLEVIVNLDRFRHMKLYARGWTTRIDSHRPWLKPWSKVDVEVPVIRRLVMLFSVDRDAPRRGMRQRFIDKVAGRDVSLPPEMHLKLFKDIPEPDLEMLFPNVEVRMKPWDKIKLGVTGGGGTIGGFAATVSKVTVATNPMALVIAIGGFAALLFRQVKNVFTQRTAYMMQLSQHLYFHNLASNFGVISRIVDLAQAEDAKESLLAWCLLAFEGPQPGAAALDSLAEQRLREWFSVVADFEVDDALAKLEADGLVTRGDNGSISALPLKEAFQRLDAAWDALYKT